MPKTKYLAVAALACAVAVFLGWKLRDMQPAASGTGVSAGIDQPTGAVGTSPGQAPGGSPQRLESRVERAARLAEARAEQRDRTRATVAAGKQNLQSAFAAEKPNPGWARGKEADLERSVVNPQMEAINAIPTNFDVECRSATCRIEADFASSSAADDWAILYLTNNGGLLPRSTINKTSQPDGTVKIVLLGATR